MPHSLSTNNANSPQSGTKVKDDLDYFEASRLLQYDPETGVLRWRTTRHHRAKAGDVAGTLQKSTGYLLVTINGRKHRHHRICWLLATGKWPENYIDHINHDKTDNRLCNLRDVDHRTNLLHRKKPSTGGYPGISWNTNAARWQVDICNDYVGSYIDWWDAICGRKAAENQYGYNTPDTR